jgi:hypothetical protein
MPAERADQAAGGERFGAEAWLRPDDSHADRRRRKRRLTKGPTEFREIRGDLPKPRGEHARHEIHIQRQSFRDGATGSAQSAAR